MTGKIEVPDQLTGDGRPIHVLYVHHAGAFGGASRSLLELIDGFPHGSVIPRIVTQRGTVPHAFTRKGIELVDTVGISQFDHTQFNYYRGRRWLVLIREVLYLPFTLLALIRARTRWRHIDIVHVNEIVAVSAVVFGKILFGCPVVVHVRSVQEARHGPLRRRFLVRLLRRYASAVIAIDETVRQSLPPDIDVQVVHNSYAAKMQGPERSSAEPPLPPRSPAVVRVAMVGSPLSFKGVQEFVNAARICRERNLPAEFLIAGMHASRRPGPAKMVLRAMGFAHDATGEVQRLVEEYGLADCLRLLEFTSEIDQVYANIDVLCFPSHLHAVGRPVIEAAVWKVPSIVAVRNPQPDTMIDRETGLCIEPGDAEAIADAVSYFCRNRSELTRMGEAAHRLALDNFDSRRNAARVLKIYRRVLAGVSGTASA